YGPTCYKKITLQESLHENSNKIEEELKFLKIELKMVKKTLRELKANPIQSNGFTSSQASPIVRIKKEENQLERDASKGYMREVIQELKACFQNCNGDVKSMLKPVQIDTNLIGTSQGAIV
ncbi:MAG: hypothetical protein ACFFCG_08735, partial [Promethearchaeota archaeon]